MAERARPRGRDQVKWIRLTCSGPLLASTWTAVDRVNESQHSSALGGEREHVVARVPRNVLVASVPGWRLAWSGRFFTPPLCTVRGAKRPKRTRFCSKIARSLAEHTSHSSIRSKASILAHRTASESHAESHFLMSQHHPERLDRARSQGTRTDLSRGRRPCRTLARAPASPRPL